MDNALQGKCCKAVTNFEYPMKKCIGKECIAEKKRKQLFPPTEQEMDADPVRATNCLSIFSYQQFYVRICHRSKDSIVKLKNTLIFGVLKTIPKSNLSEVMSKF